MEKGWNKSKLEKTVFVEWDNENVKSREKSKVVKKFFPCSSLGPSCMSSCVYVFATSDNRFNVIMQKRDVERDLLQIRNIIHQHMQKFLSQFAQIRDMNALLLATCALVGRNFSLPCIKQQKKESERWNLLRIKQQRELPNGKVSLSPAPAGRKRRIFRVFIKFTDVKGK